MPRLLFVVTEDWYFWSHRRHLARASVEAGWQVAVATRVTAHAEAIKELGIDVIPMPWDRGGLNPFSELRCAFALFHAIASWRPDIMHYVALKPVLAGLLQPRGLPTVNAITGLGYVFTEGGKRPGWLKHAVERALGMALRRTRAHTVVQNDDDAALAARLQPRAQGHIHVIPGAGLDLSQYPYLAEPSEPTVRFALVARMLWDKGVGEFVAAIAALRREGLDVVAELVGAPDSENRASITQAQLEAWQADGLVEWHGWSRDVATIWARAHVAVLPSYREGLPKALIEAAACGRPMITTDVPGCRSVVQHEVNGLLVPRASTDGLVEAMRRLAQDRTLRTRLGEAARQQVEERYAIGNIAASFHSVYARAMSGGNRLSS
jgi:glycosyltransferase involved in cell wall biosynthesis